MKPFENLLFYNFKNLGLFCLVEENVRRSKEENSWEKRLKGDMFSQEEMFSDVNVSLLKKETFLDWTYSHQLISAFHKAPMYLYRIFNIHSLLYACHFISSLKSKACLIAFCSIQLCSLPAGQVWGKPAEDPRRPRGVVKRASK